MITFQEHPQTGYAMRTWDNARLSDLTIAFAIDFTTAGELLTRKAAYGKYLGVNISELLENINSPIPEVLKKVKGKKCLNIAGNGIYSLKHLCDQKFIDDIIFKFLSILKLNFETPFSIRSGGQTGVDEAALKAGDKLGLETICLAPKGWLFRDINNKDICSQALFLKRFGPQYDITDIL